LSRGRLGGAVAGALLLALAATGSARAAGGGIGLRLLDVPSVASLDPRARIYIVDHLAPGTVIHRRIEITNTTASGARVVLYPAAAGLGKGSFLAAAGHARNELSTWTRVRPGASKIAAGRPMQAVVTIAVPRDAAPGERYGVVWAEVRSAPPSGGITQVNRVGVRLYLSVGPGGRPPADFTINALTTTRTAEGQPAVIAKVHNTGGRALDMSGTLRLGAGPGGLKAGPFPATLGTTLAIGASERVTIPLDRRLPVGPWKARVDLHSGLIERHAQATITFRPAAREATSWPSLVVALAALALLLGMTALIVVVRR
jgi:hypothetical protein